MSAPPLWLRSLRSRPLMSVLLLLLSSAAVLTSLLGPLLVRAVHQSTLADAVADGGALGTSISVSLELQPGDRYDLARRDVAAAFGGVVVGAGRKLWQPVRLGTESTSSLGWIPAAGGGVELSSRVNAIDPGCRRYVLTAGRCPAGAGEVLVSAVDAGRPRLGVGSELAFRLPSVPVTRLRVVGVYDSDRSAPLELARPDSVNGQLARVTADPLVATEKQLQQLQIGEQVTGRLLLRSGLGVQDEPAARLAMDVVKARSLAVSGRLLLFDSSLPELLDGVDRQVSSAAALILVTVVQAEVLAFFALSIVLQRLARARAAEWGIGRLRGVPRRRWLASIYTEPALALLAGLPAGVLAGVGAGRLIVAHNLRVGTPVEWSRWPVLAVAVGAVVGALLALVAVSMRSVRRPLVELISEASEPRGLTVVGAVGQAAVVLLAAAALYQLWNGGVLSGGRGSQLGLLAPGLFALALAVVAVRVAVLVVRRLTARPPRSLVGLVVGRQVARTPSALNPAMVIAAGLALAVFATQVLALSVRNQGLRADAVVGAATVLHVAAPGGVDLVSAVRAADPSGRYAMAVKEKAASSDGGTSRIVAVDSTRLAAVTAWSPAWTEVGDLATALHPATEPPVTLRGTRGTLTLANVTVKLSRNESTIGTPAPPQLSLIVEAAGRWQMVPFGSLTSSSTRLRAELPCPAGCRLVAVDLYSGKGSAYHASFTVTSIGTDQQPPVGSAAWLRQPGGWRERVGQFTGPDRSQSVTPTPTGAGLVVRASDVDGDNHNQIVPADTDDPLPAIAAAGLQLAPFPGLNSAAIGTGLDGQSQLLRVVGRASVLPRSLNDGVLVDLRNAGNLSDPAASEAVSEVWLALAAPANIESALTAAGMQIQSRELLGTVQHRLEEQGNTRGARVAVWIAYTTLLLTLLTLVAARMADASRRRADWATLRDAGLHPATVRRLVLVEVAAPALLGAVLGLAGGIAAVKVAAPRLPLVDVYAPGPPLDVALSWTPILVLGAATGVVIAVVAAVAAQLETRTGERR